MATPVWQAGTLYAPGALVQPQTALPPTGYALTNPGFESGSADWTLGAGMSVGTSGVYAGTSSLVCTGTSGTVVAVHDAVPVTPGTSITATCMYHQGAASSGQNIGRVGLRWYDSGMVQFGADSDGSQVTSSSGGYKQSTVTAAAPPGSAFVAVIGKVGRTSSSTSWFDNFTWSYGAYIVPSGLIYKAVQATTGYSDTDEPTWPTTLGVTVVDNQVTWEAVQANRVIWEASPIMLSGGTEPVWPTEPGQFVSDGTISWEVISRRVEDENCPNSKVVVIVASKVFAADGDIVRFSATANPLDWTTPDDAGYLPTGLQQANANDMAVLNQYRSNLVAFNASSFQNWQADPDPAAMAILDQMDGIGSTWQQAAQPVAEELFFLSQRGVRTVGIAAGAENLAAGDVGAPIDILVQAALSDATARPVATYYPGAGQYWLAMRGPLPTYAGPTITGAAPDGVVGDVYPGYAYTVTPGDAPILSVKLTDGEVPAGLEYDAGVIAASDEPTVSGTYTPTQTVMDENGLTGTLTDHIVIVPEAGVMMAQPTGTFPAYSTDGGLNWSICANNAAPGTQDMKALESGSFIATNRYTANLGATAWSVATSVGNKNFHMTQRGANVVWGANGPFDQPQISSDGGVTAVGGGASGNGVHSVVYSGDTGPLLGVGKDTDFRVSADHGATFTATGVAHGLNGNNTSHASCKYSGGAAFAGSNAGITQLRVVFTETGASFTGGDITGLGSTSTSVGKRASFMCAGKVGGIETIVVLGNLAGELFWTQNPNDAAPTWHLVTYPLGAGILLDAIAWNGVRFVLGGALASVGYLKHSTDLVTWANCTIPAGPQGYYAIASQPGSA